MSEVMKVEAKIRELVDAARAEMSGSPVHIDVDNVKDMMDEIEEHQQRIWELES